MTTRTPGKYWVAAKGLHLVTSRHGAQRFSPHTHRAFSIMVIESGTFQFDRLSRSHELGPGDIALTGPGVVHSGGTVGGGPWVARSFYLSQEFVNGALDPDRDMAPFCCFDTPWICGSELATSLGAFHRSLDDGRTATAEEIRSSLRPLFAQHAVRTPEDELKPMRDALRRVMDHLQVDLSQQPTLHELAQTAGLSPFHLLRVFRDATGLTPHAWLMQQRVDHAMDLMQEGVPIVEVARRTGFADQSHLSRRFKQVLAIPPGRFVRGCVAKEQ